MQTKRKERAHAQQSLKKAQESIERLSAEQASLVQARTLGTTTQCWQPAIVNYHHTQMLASTPVVVRRLS